MSQRDATGELLSTMPDGKAMGELPSAISKCNATGELQSYMSQRDLLISSGFPWTGALLIETRVGFSYWEGPEAERLPVKTTKPHSA